MASLASPTAKAWQATSSATKEEAHAASRVMLKPPTPKTWATRLEMEEGIAPTAAMAGFHSWPRAASSASNCALKSSTWATGTPRANSAALRRLK